MLGKSKLRLVLSSPLQAKYNISRDILSRFSVNRNVCRLPLLLCAVLAVGGALCQPWCLLAALCVAWLAADGGRSSRSPRPAGQAAATTQRAP